MKEIKTYVVDLFCGAGGTSTAIHESNSNIEVNVGKALFQSIDKSIQNG